MFISPDLVLNEEAHRLVKCVCSHFLLRANRTRRAA